MTKCQDVLDRKFTNDSSWEEYFFQLYSKLLDGEQICTKFSLPLNPREPVEGSSLASRKSSGLHNYKTIYTELIAKLSSQTQN